MEEKRGIRIVKRSTASRPAPEGEIPVEEKPDYERMYIELSKEFAAYKAKHEPTEPDGYGTIDLNALLNGNISASKLASQQTNAVAAQAMAKQQMNSLKNMYAKQANYIRKTEIEKENFDNMLHALLPEDDEYVTPKKESSKSKRSSSAGNNLDTIDLDSLLNGF